MLRHLLSMCGAAALLLAGPCAAAWQKIGSPHFVIYADGDPGTLREFASRLEKFDKAVRQVRAMPDPPLGDGNRLTIFVVPDVKSVQRLAVATPGMTTNLAGFYKPKAEGSIAVVPERSGDSGKRQLDDQSTFFHEYAHHLMFGDTASPVPLWYAEGFAEFMSTATFARDGSVMLGRAATGRADGLTDKRTFPLGQMLGGKSENLSEAEWSQLYSRGWLLTHFLTFEPSRKGQLQTYLAAIAKGVDLTTASAVFGDLAVLDRNLAGYATRNRLNAVRVAPEALKIGAITVEPVSVGAAEVLPHRMRLETDVLTSEQAALLEDIRKAAARHPADAFVQETLAAAELLLHHYAASEVAADRALAANPHSIQAMVYKGHAVLEQAAQDEKGKTFADARKWFQKANLADPEDPEPLMNFHEASRRDSGRPSANAIAALHQASRLAPQDLGLSMQSAWQHLADGQLAEARRALVPIAFNPHAIGASKKALAAIARIDAGDAKGAQNAMSGN
ncbi:MAG: hypothetical protein ABI412_04695 [Sphingomicrobium sp.]